jgi:hypothetical protein
VSLPIIILGGSDRSPTELPEQGRDEHPLSGYKGVDIRFRGRPLVEGLLERLARCGHFGPSYVAGPVSVYRRFGDRAVLIDTDGSFGENIRVSLEAVREKHPGSPIAFITCDVLPEAETLLAVMENYARQCPCDFYYPLIRVPEDRTRLGASGWKPSYPVVPRKGQPTVEVLPGHLIVIDPQALRLKFLYRLFDLAYRTRNRSVDYRLAVLLGGVLARLVYQDVLHLLNLRLPNITWDVLRAALPGTGALKRGTLTHAQAESALRSIFVKMRHRKSYPRRRALLPILEGLSLALDIDTEEEARAMGGDLRSEDEVDDETQGDGLDRIERA